MGGQHPLLQKVAIYLFEVCLQSASVERMCKSEGVIHTEMRSRLSNVTVQMLLYLYVNLSLLNTLTGEMGDFLRDSNSHEFEEIVDPITYIPSEEIEERLDEIDETLLEKEASVVTVCSWSNVSSENRGGAIKRSKMDDKVLVIDSPPDTPKK